MFVNQSTFSYPSFPNDPVDQLTDSDCLTVTPRGLGLGQDRIIGGANAPRYRVIDLSLLDCHVEIIWSRPGAGVITDGADSLVFQGVEEVILPVCMREKLGAA